MSDELGKMFEEVPAKPQVAEFPRYRCFKEVEALKIKSVLNPNVDDGSLVLTFAEPGYEAGAFVVDREYVRKHNPQPGGYWVRYADGYQSFSPAEAFESGYTRI